MKKLSEVKPSCTCPSLVQIQLSISVHERSELNRRLNSRTDPELSLLARSIGRTNNASRLMTNMVAPGTIRYHEHTYVASVK